MYLILKHLLFGGIALLLLIQKFGVVAAPQNSLIALVKQDVDACHEKIGSSLVRELTLKSKAMIRPYEKLIAKLSKLDKSICTVECEELFTITYKSIDHDLISGMRDAKALEEVRALYSIRKAICETRVTIAKVPPSCIKLLPKVEPNASRQSIIKSELELATSSEVQNCLHKFQDHHFFWTSYSNNLQESNEMVHMFRSDIELRSMVMTYRDFEASIMDLEKDLTEMRERNMEWLKQAERSAQSLVDTQDDAFAKFDRGFQSSSKMIQSGLDHVASALHGHEARLKEMSAIASEELKGVVKEFLSVNVAVVRMQRDISQLYAGVASELAGLRRAQSDAFEDTLNTLTDKLAPIVGNLGHLEIESRRAFNGVQQFNQFHTVNLNLLHEQYNLSALVLMQLGASLDMINSTRETMEQVSTHAQVLGSTLHSVAYLFAFCERYSDMLVILVLYMALCLVLTPLDRILIPSHAVSKIKAIFWAFASADFIFEHIQSWNQDKNLSQFLDVASIILFCVLLFTVLVIVIGSWMNNRSLMTLRQSHEVELVPDYDIERIPDYHSLKRAMKYYDAEFEAYRDIERISLPDSQLDFDNWYYRDFEARREALDAQIYDDQHEWSQMSLRTIRAGTAPPGL